MGEPFALADQFDTSGAKDVECIDASDDNNASNASDALYAAIAQHANGERMKRLWSIVNKSA